MMAPTIDHDRLALFSSVYRGELARVAADNPDYAHISVADVDVVAGRMLNAFRAGTVSIDSPAIRAACRILGVKHTYTALYAWLAGPDRGMS